MANNGRNAHQQNLAADLLAAAKNQRCLMEEALMRLGLSKVAAREFMNNSINSLQGLRLLMEDSLDRLIKQIHCDNQGAGIIHPIFLSRISVCHPFLD